ncbi:hypothetical protein Tco_0441988 [Tanacetum coccineum]
MLTTRPACPHLLLALLISQRLRESLPSVPDYTPGNGSRVHTHDHDGSEALDKSPDSILSSEPKPLGKHRPPPSTTTIFLLESHPIPHKLRLRNISHTSTGGGMYREVGSGEVEFDGNAAVNCINDVPEWDAILSVWIWVWTTQNDGSNGDGMCRWSCAL